MSSDSAQIVVFGIFALVVMFIYGIALQFPKTDPLNPMKTIPPTTTQRIQGWILILIPSSLALYGFYYNNNNNNNKLN